MNLQSPRKTCVIVNNVSIRMAVPQDHNSTEASWRERMKKMMVGISISMMVKIRMTMATQLEVVRSAFSPFLMMSQFTASGATIW